VAPNPQITKTENFTREKFVVDFGQIFGEVMDVREFCEQNFSSLRAIINN
jgi:hypothetical protein